MNAMEGTATIRQFEVPGLAQYSYVIASEGEAMVIDAMRDFDRYTAYAARHSLQMRHIAETHIHADFAAGSVGLAEATGAGLALSGYDEGELYRYAMPHRGLRSGDAISVGRLRLEALHTPGHTPEHLSFVLFDPKVSEERPVAIFTGDFLFAGSLGRPDLLGEEAKAGLAHELYRSMHQRIAHLPDEVAVYPGHGAGSLCGSSISSNARTTLGHERMEQKLFHLGEEEFVLQILGSVPPMPLYYPRMKRLNAAGASAYRPGQPIAVIPAGELESMAAAGGVTVIDLRVIDLRSPAEFARSHVRGALNLGAGPNLSLWAGWLLDAERPLVLVGATGEAAELEEARRSLARVGLDRVAGMLAGGMAAWEAQGLPVERMPELKPAELVSRIGEAVILDVRGEEEWASGHIAEALRIPLGDLPRRMAEIPRDREVVTVCGSGYRASAAGSLIAAAGGRAASLQGGMDAWRGQALPVAQGRM